MNIHEESQWIRSGIKATENLRGIIVLARLGGPDCMRCGDYVDPSNLCQLPNGDYLYLCDACVADIWSRCLTADPENKNRVADVSARDHFEDKMIAALSDKETVFKILVKLRETNQKKQPEDGDISEDLAVISGMKAYLESEEGLIKTKNNQPVTYQKEKEGETPAETEC